MNKKSIVLITALVLITVLGACSNKGKDTTEFVEEGTISASDDMSIPVIRKDGLGKTIQSAGLCYIDKDWGNYVFINGEKMSEDNSYEIISKISTEQSTENDNMFYIKNSNGDVLGYVTGDMSYTSFTSPNYDYAKDNDDLIYCGDTYDEVIKVLGEPYYDDLKESGQIVYSADTKQLTLQFDNDVTCRRLCGFYISEISSH